MRCGLLGKTLEHSYSPLLYEQFGIRNYVLHELPPAEVAQFVRGYAPKGERAALNVTIPYKKTVLPLCDSLSAVARRLGNVNTLLWDADGKLYGDNTDYAGFLFLLQCASTEPCGKEALILGTGGAAQTAALALQGLGAHSVTLLTRKELESSAIPENCAQAQILINATPVGMYPANAEQPFSITRLPQLEWVADLIYNPLHTPLLLEAQAHGIPNTNGLSMLAGQGCAAAALFLREKIESQRAERVYRTLLHRVENIVLIGMPGCGKSTVGQALAKKTKRGFVDTDVLLEVETGYSPAQFIAQKGEAAFRTAEAKVLQKAAKESGLVIATGGGSILRDENRIALRRNGRLYWLQRPLASLSVHSRPLSGDLTRLYEQRRPLYEQAADASIDAAQTVPQIAQDILEEFYAYTGAQRSESESAGDA